MLAPDSVIPLCPPLAMPLFELTPDLTDLGDAELLSQAAGASVAQPQIFSSAFVDSASVEVNWGRFGRRQTPPDPRAQQLSSQQYQGGAGGYSNNYNANWDAQHYRNGGGGQFQGGGGYSDRYQAQDDHDLRVRRFRPPQNQQRQFLSQLGQRFYLQQHNRN